MQHCHRFHSLGMNRLSQEKNLQVSMWVVIVQLFHQTQRGIKHCMYISLEQGCQTCGPLAITSPVGCSMWPRLMNFEN